MTFCAKELNDFALYIAVKKRYTANATGSDCPAQKTPLCVSKGALGKSDG